MRYVYVILIVLLAALVLLFAVQNMSLVTVALLSWQITLPAALMYLALYVLGMFTGGFVLGFIRSLTTRAQTNPAL